MSTQAIVEAVGELVVDDGKTLEQQHGSKALAVAQEIQSALVPCVAQDPAYAPLWEQFQAAPREQAPALAGVLQVILGADAALAQRLDVLLQQYQQAKSASSTVVDTGGGAYARDVTLDDGDYVGGNQIRITGDGNVVGHGSSATVIRSESASSEELARLFARVHQEIKARPEDPDVEKQEIAETVDKIQEEAAKGDKANPKKIERWLKTLASMADDIFEVTAACLLNPVAGVATVIRKVVEKAKAEKAQT
jgi:hypothetical protein